MGRLNMKFNGESLPPTGNNHHLLRCLLSNLSGGSFKKYSPLLTFSAAKRPQKAFRSVKVKGKFLTFD